MVVASIQVDLDEQVLARFREDLLLRVSESGCRGVILDVSGLETLDCEEFAALRLVMAMVGIMGAESVIVGLRPGVVSALIEAGAEVDGIRAAINLDAAYAMLQSAPESVEVPEDVVEEVVEEVVGVFIGENSDPLDVRPPVFGEAEESAR